MRESPVGKTGGASLDEPAAEDLREPATDLSPEELAEAREYGRLDLSCTIADRLLDVVLLVAMTALFARPDAGLVQWIAGLTSIESLRLVILFMVLVAISLVVGFPLSYYSGHVLEHRFQLSRQSLGRWLWRYAKRHALELVLGTVLLVGLYWMIWLAGPWWWLVAAAGFFLVSIVLGQLAPVLILPLFYKIERIEGESSAELQRRLARLAEGTGLAIEGVYRMDLSEETVKANAMLAGLGRTRRVLMGDTLLENFSPEEIEVIFAHEIGHHVYRHIHKMIALGLAYSTAGFFVCDRLLGWWFGGSAQESLADFYGSLPFYTLPAVMLILTLFAMLTEPLQNAISRHFERQCDRYALVRTGLRDAYVSAFRKLARQNKDDPDPHPLEVVLFHSHPPIRQRLAAAD